jgi:hypothetical protein
MGSDRRHGSMTTAIPYSECSPITGELPFCPSKSLYTQARQRARRGQFWSSLTGRPRALYALKQVRATCTIEDKSDGGTRPVPISHIRGSEGRCRYFDAEFNPLYDRAQGRWLSIARARHQGKHLPPIVLVQVGDVYFVRDGHHRISVARAMGQIDIEARVTVWQVTGPLPWEMVADAPSPGPVRHLLDAWRAKKKGLQGLFGRAHGPLVRAPSPGK